MGHVPVVGPCDEVIRAVEGDRRQVLGIRASADVDTIGIEHTHLSSQAGPVDVGQLVAVIVPRYEVPVAIEADRRVFGKGLKRGTHAHARSVERNACPRYPTGHDATGIDRESWP